MLQMGELLRMQATEVQKLKAMMPMLSDPDLRQEVQTCVSTSSAHAKALLDFCQANGLA
jgi:predicted metal-dependent hydrolase